MAEQGLKIFDGLQSSPSQKAFCLFNIRTVRQNYISLNVPEYVLCYDESCQLHKAGSTALKQILTWHS